VTVGAELPYPGIPVHSLFSARFTALKARRLREGAVLGVVLWPRSRFLLVSCLSAFLGLPQVKMLCCGTVTKTASAVNIDKQIKQDRESSLRSEAALARYIRIPS